MSTDWKALAPDHVRQGYLADRKLSGVGPGTITPGPPSRIPRDAMQFVAFRKLPTGQTIDAQPSSITFDVTVLPFWSTLVAYMFVSPLTGEP